MLLLLLILLVLLFIIIIWNPTLCHTKQKEKRSQRYLRCGKSLFNYGNISMFNRA